VFSNFKAFAAVSAIVAVVFLALGTLIFRPDPPPGAGWGVDACLATFAPPSQIDRYLTLLQQADLAYVRERSPGNLKDPADRSRGPLSVFRRLHARGFNVVAFLGLSGDLKRSQDEDVLPEDLLAVYWSARWMARAAGREVQVWEMVGEPDTHFCKDLPERLVAFQKSVYLGIKDGGKTTFASGRLAGSAPGVLMGALGHFPSPWLERAARNGLFDYTDGLNFHFYGHARDLDGVIEAQRRFASHYTGERTLPLWITECGMDALPYDQPDDPHGRELQRTFTLSTMESARRQGVSVFMPFIFVAPTPGGHTLTKSPTEPYPAWTAFAKETRLSSLASAPALLPPKNPSRIVLQWMPDNRTCLPHKVSGMYWYREDDEGKILPIAGKVTAYNFSDRLVRGTLAFEAPAGTGIQADSGDLAIPPFGKADVPVMLTDRGTGYLRQDVRVTFQSRDAGSAPNRLEFQVGTRPSADLLPRIFPLIGHQPGPGFEWIWAPEPFEVSSGSGPWIGVNGVELAPPPGAANDGDLSRPLQLTVSGPQKDIRCPPMAITKIDGLPKAADAFLRLRIPRPASLQNAVRVDLVDKQGQRFSIIENLGDDWFDPDRREIFLSYEDFHISSWGRCTATPVFRPEDIREIQLRIYPAPSPSPLLVQLDVLAP